MAPQLSFSAGSTRPALRDRAPGTLDTPRSRSRLASFGSIVFFGQNDTIYNEGDEDTCSYKVLTGAVRLSKMMSNGRRQIVKFALPGDFFGINWLHQQAETADALIDVQLLSFAYGHLQRLCDECREVRTEVISSLCHDLWATQNHLVLLGRQSALERVALFLVTLAERTREPNQHQIPMPMSRQDIADYLGLTIETVCRMLTRLRSSSIIDVGDRYSVTIRDMDALKRAAQPAESPFRRSKATSRL